MDSWRCPILRVGYGWDIICNSGLFFIVESKYKSRYCVIVRFIMVFSVSLLGGIAAEMKDIILFMQFPNSIDDQYSAFD